MNTKLNIIQALATLILVLSTFTAHAGQTSYFIYDEAGHVIGEYDANGNPIQEHVYLGDRPIAVVQGSSGGTMDYVSTDQLNTPRVVTDSSKNVLWAWNSDPFGNGSPTGSLSYNLRFPGQYYDAETGHNYNYYRDYDSGTGRYTESDPLGLNGGLNTFAYVTDNPLSNTDPAGLSGGPYHPPMGVRFACSDADSCPALTGKMQLIMKMINSHQGWDQQMPEPRGGGRHSEEIAGLWRAFANCQALFDKKCKGKMCPREPVPASAPDPEPQNGGSNSNAAAVAIGLGVAAAIILTDGAAAPLVLVP